MDWIHHPFEENAEGCGFEFTVPKLKFTLEFYESLSKLEQFQLNKHNYLSGMESLSFPFNVDKNKKFKSMEEDFEEMREFISTIQSVARTYFTKPLLFDQIGHVRNYTGVLNKEDGTTEYYLEGKLHNDIGPAIVNHKTNRWFIYGVEISEKDFNNFKNNNGKVSFIKLTKGSLIPENYTGMIFWSRVGKCSPYEFDHAQSFYKNGVLHREDGPAILFDFREVAFYSHGKVQRYEDQRWGKIEISNYPTPKPSGLTIEEERQAWVVPTQYHDPNYTGWIHILKKESDEEWVYVMKNEN